MNPLERIQTDTEGFLLSHDELKYCSITRIRPRTAGEATNIQTKLDSVLAGLVDRNGKKGMSILVNMPEIGRAEANVRAPTGEMMLHVDLIENVIINMGAEGTGVACEAYAWEVARLLQHQTFHPSGPLVAAPRLIDPQQERVLEKRVCYRVSFSVGVRAENKAKVAQPTFAQADNFITLNCPTGGAAIYYTTDGSFPGPGNETAALYVAPFPLAVGTHALRVGAYVSGMAGSHTVDAIITVTAP